VSGEYNGPESWIKRTMEYAVAILKNPSVFRERKYVFIVSHMRSYSTLLAHILGSHEQFSGYAENFLSYLGPLDLFKLRCRTSAAGNFKSKCTYVVDKILHADLQLSDQILTNQDITFLFMIRRPRETLKSIIGMERNEAKKRGGLAEGPLKMATPEAALAYYAARVDALGDLATRIGRSGSSAYVLEAERIVDDTKMVLEQLGQHLHLHRALDENYSLFDLTGRWGRGDMSPYIRTGSIQRERSSYPEIELPNACLEQAEHHYDQCLHVLKENCRPLIERPQESVGVMP